MRKERRRGGPPVGGLDSRCFLLFYKWFSHCASVCCCFVVICLSLHFPFLHFHFILVVLCVSLWDARKFTTFIHCCHTAAVYKCSVSEDGNRGEIFSGSWEVPQQPEVAVKLRDGSGSPDLTVNFIKKPNLKSRGGDCVLNPNQSVICQDCVFEIFDRI